MVVVVVVVMVVVGEVATELMVLVLLVGARPGCHELLHKL